MRGLDRLLCSTSMSSLSLSFVVCMRGRLVSGGATISTSSSLSSGEDLRCSMDCGGGGGVDVDDFMKMIASLVFMLQSVCVCVYWTESDDGGMAWQEQWMRNETGFQLKLFQIYENY